MRGLLNLLYMFQAIGNAFLAAQVKQREIERHDQERQLREQNIQQAHNKTVITDIEVEELAIEMERKRLDLRKAQLDILKQERGLGLNGTEFKPDDYE